METAKENTTEIEDEMEDFWVIAKISRSDELSSITNRMGWRWDIFVEAILNEYDLDNPSIKNSHVEVSYHKNIIFLSQTVKLEDSRESFLNK